MGAAKVGLDTARQDSLASVQKAKKYCGGAKRTYNMMHATLGSPGDMLKSARNAQQTETDRRFSFGGTEMAGGADGGTPGGTPGAGGGQGAAAGGAAAGGAAAGDGAAGDRAPGRGRTMRERRAAGDEEELINEEDEEAGEEEDEDAEAGAGQGGEEEFENEELERDLLTSGE